ncbi:MAG: hypothetical protein F6K28_59715 [Microcoleus sp. SIO2G3]|nr:hypothetical protein [Microcoleus sp. SIO2G3]
MIVSTFTQIEPMKKLSSFLLATLLFVSILLFITPNALAQTDANTSKVVIFGDGNFQGDSQELSVGSYGINDLSIGNNKLSSLKVPVGLKVTLYADGGFKGKSKTFTSDARWVGDDFNDLTSSIKVSQVTQAEGEILTIPLEKSSVKTSKEIKHRVCNLHHKTDLEHPHPGLPH